MDIEGIVAIDPILRRRPSQPDHDDSDGFSELSEGGRFVRKHLPRFLILVLIFSALFVFQFGVYKAMSRTLVLNHPSSKVKQIIVEDDLKNGDLESFIATATAATPGEFPWMVNIREVTSESGSEMFKCGGSLISENVVLTAAHCVFSHDTKEILTTEQIILVVGDYNISGHDEGEQVVYAQDIRIHEQYRWNDKENDIALIKITGKLHPIKPAPAYVPLPLFNILENATTGVVLGWGATDGDNNKGLSEILLKTEIPMLPHETCKIRDMNLQFCAGGNGNNACDGDSGGPLMCSYDNALVACGIVSSGTKPSCGDAPGIYTNVYGYRNWIEDNRDFTKPPVTTPAAANDLDNKFEFSWPIFLVSFFLTYLIITAATIYCRRWGFRKREETEPSQEY